MSQKQVVLDKLREGPLCSYSFFYTEGLTHRMGARIHELRRSGYLILSRPCEQEHRHESSAVEYILVGQDVLQWAP